MLTEMVELGVLVPYPDDGRDARDQRRPSVLHAKHIHHCGLEVCERNLEDVTRRVKPRSMSGTPEGREGKR